MTARAGEINGWVCNGVANPGGTLNGPEPPYCGRITYAIHVDDGVTPMFLVCRAEGAEPDEAECKGMGMSLMYPEPPAPDYVLEAVAWEWYRPSSEEAREMGDAMYEHIRRGGLAIRPLTDVGRARLEAHREAA